jgi:flagellar biosynthesis/type III secretory pathway chaperone
MAGAVVANDALFELVNSLGCVSATLTDMAVVLDSQRQAVAENDLTRLLAITSEQEELTARLERCERPRQHVQEKIEQELEVTGVRAIIAALPEMLLFRIRLAELVDEIGPKVQVLHQHSQRSSQLLKVSIKRAHRARSYVLRLAGTEPTRTAPLVTP